MAINKLSDVHRRNFLYKYNTGVLSNYTNHIRYIGKLGKNINKLLMFNFDIIRSSFQILSTILYISNEDYGCEEGMDRNIHIEYEDYIVTSFNVNSNVLSDWKCNFRRFPIR